MTVTDNFAETELAAVFWIFLLFEQFLYFDAFFCTKINDNLIFDGDGKKTRTGDISRTNTSDLIFVQNLFRQNILDKNEIYTKKYILDRRMKMFYKKTNF